MIYDNILVGKGGCMLTIETINIILTSFLTVVIIICSVGIIIATKFQNKQKKKYQECLNLIKEKENGVINPNDGVDITRIKKIDKSIDVNKLMVNLYDTYLEFVKRLNTNSNVSSLLDDFIGELYKSKIEIYKTKGFYEITDNIELINYSILEFQKNKLKFRVNISCFNYKLRGNLVISGSNIEKLEQIFLLTFVKKNKKWIINNIEKVYEKKLGA